MGASWRNLVGVPAGIESVRAVTVPSATARVRWPTAGLLMRYGCCGVIDVPEGGTDTWVRLGLRLERAGSGRPRCAK